MCGEVHSVSWSGAHRSANVGISSKNPDENSGHRKSKVSWAMMINPGLGGPKVYPAKQE